MFFIPRWKFKAIMLLEHGHFNTSCYIIQTLPECGHVVPLTLCRCSVFYHNSTQNTTSALFHGRFVLCHGLWKSATQLSQPVHFQMATDVCSSHQPAQKFKKKSMFDLKNTTKTTNTWLYLPHSLPSQCEVQEGRAHLEVIEITFIGCM